MLTARQAPQACHSCRLQLLSLFSHGFAPSIHPTPRLSRRAGLRTLSSHSPHNGLNQARRNGQRTFASTARNREQALPDVEPAELPSAADIEQTVRQARRTFGETLPKDFLSHEEYLLYERLYGPPVRETTIDDLEVLEQEEEEGSSVQLLRENEQGELEEVTEEVLDGETYAVDGVRLEKGEFVEEIEAVEEELGLEVGESEVGNFTVQARSQREVDAILRLQKDMDTAMARPVEEEEDVDEEYEEEEEMEEEEEEEIDEDEDAYLGGDALRTHPSTLIGRSGTSPSTIYLPKEQFLQPISELLERANHKHLTEAAEKAFGGKGLPFSTSTPRSKSMLVQKHIGLEAGQFRMSEVEADAYMAAVMPGVYSSVVSTLVEVRKRLGSNWIRDLLFRDGGEGPRVLDAGAGGAGLIAWREIVQAEWDVLREEGIVEGETAPHGKATALTGASTLRHRMSRFLENTTFLPRLPDYVHSTNPKSRLDGGPPVDRKIYDVIIAPHTLFPLKDEFKRKNLVHNLWSQLDPNGGVLILLEKGLPRGFEAIAAARSLLLDKHISSPESTHLPSRLDSPTEEQFTKKETGMIIAPCTNHTACPMYPVPGMSHGRKDFCHFSQRFIRPPFLQRILGASDRNHEDVKFSYLAVRRGMDARQATSSSPGFEQSETATLAALKGFEGEAHEEGVEAAEIVAINALSLPRTILAPLKRRKHVVLDLCTPSGTLERWTVPKSFSDAAYRDARKSKWGDLWALGAKTRVLRKPRLGRKGDDVLLAPRKKKGSRKGRDLAAVERKRRTGKNVFEVEVGDQGMGEVREARGRPGDDRVERRTKGGRVERKTKVIKDDDI